MHLGARGTLRLVDYAMHDGCNVRTWVCLRVAQNTPDVCLKDLTFYTRLDPLALIPQERPIKTKDDLAAQDAGYVVFEPNPP